MTVDTASGAAVVFGEVLWDVFADRRRLGGAALNFAAHARALGHPVSLISALGEDELGREAAATIARLDLDTTFLQTSAKFATGTARVTMGPGGEPEFTILRPAAYDAVELTVDSLTELSDREPAWVYFGTLLAATPSGRHALERLLESLANTTRFLDLNLRSGSDAPALMLAMLEHADVVKLNQAELERVHAVTGLPPDLREFCVAASERFGWRAVCVTLGARGCAVHAGGEYCEAPAVPIVVADSVGAGDAFAAGFMHGLSLGWTAGEIAAFANAVAAAVAARPESLPEQ